MVMQIKLIVVVVVVDNNLLLYGSANLPDKIELSAFLCFNLEFIPFSPKIRIFFRSNVGF